MFVEDCLTRKVIFFTGKGGVGKTTLVWATALACRRKGLRVTVASWDPFETSEPQVPQVEGVKWVALETLSAFKEYALQILKFEAIYNVAFDNHVLRTFLKAAPGLSETVISGKIWDLYQKEEQDLILVDLPASGHALSFFQSPIGVQKIFAIGFVNKEAGKILDLFQSSKTRIDLVTLPEELPITETRELKSKLSALAPYKFGFLHVNQCVPNFTVDSKRVPDEYRAIVNRHLESQRLQEDVLRDTDSFGLRKILIPRLALDKESSILESVADTLESAE